MSKEIVFDESNINAPYQLYSDNPLVEGVNSRFPKKALVAAVTAAAVAVYCGRGGAGVSVSIDTPVPANTMSPAQNTEIASNQDLFPPEKRIEAVVSTSEAIKSRGWEALVREGLSQWAIDSVAQLTFYPDQNHLQNDEKLQGSGGFMWVTEPDGRRYLRFWTAGHLGGTISSFSNPEEFIFRFDRPSVFPTSGSVTLKRSDFGMDFYYGNTPEGLPTWDIGVLTFSEEFAMVNFSHMIDLNKIPTLENMSFDPVSNDDLLSGVCFPMSSNPEPTVFIGSWVNPGEDLYTPYQVIVDDGLLQEGCSAVPAFNQKGQIVGFTVGITDPVDNTPEIKALGVDDFFLASNFNTGRNYAMALLEKSLADLNSQNR